MRERYEIEHDLKVKELGLNKIKIEVSKLEKELFDYDYLLVEWKDAERFFIDHGIPKPNAQKQGVIVDERNSFSAYVSINVEDNGAKTISVGPHISRYRFPTGEPFRIERKYGLAINEYAKKKETR